MICARDFWTFATTLGAATRSPATPRLEPVLSRCSRRRPLRRHDHAQVALLRGSERGALAGARDGLCERFGTREAERREIRRGWDLKPSARCCGAGVVVPVGRVPEERNLMDDARDSEGIEAFLEAASARGRLLGPQEDEPREAAARGFVALRSRREGPGDLTLESQGAHAEPAGDERTLRSSRRGRKARGMVRSGL
jgi:hypothetical protein